MARSTTKTALAGHLDAHGYQNENFDMILDEVATWWCNEVFEPTTDAEIERFNNTTHALAKKYEAGTLTYADA